VTNVSLFSNGQLWVPTAAHAIAHAAHRSRIKLWEKSVVDKYEEEKEKV